MRVRFHVVAVVLFGLAMASGCGGPATGDPCADLGASGCRLPSVAYTCANGFYLEHDCRHGDVCENGACSAVVCTTGDFRCDGDVAVVCTAGGTVEKSDDCGAKGQVCVVQPLTAECVAQTCTPLTTYCSGAELRKCAGDGLSYDVVQTCDDPDGTGRTCVGSGCIDRCTLTEAHDRSTLGCRFVGVTGAVPDVLVGNPQPDLPATVTLTRSDGTMSTTVSIPAGGVSELNLAATTIGGGSGLGLGFRVTSNLPVFAFAQTPLHPVHALSTSYVGGLGSGTESLLVIADAASDVTITTPVATAAGAGVPAVAAGGTLAQHLGAGQALELAASGPLAGVTVTTTTPVAVFVVDSAATSMPGVETLGRDHFVVGSALLVAPTATTVTTRLDGVFSLTAGQTHAISAGQRISSTSPVLVVSDGALVPPTAQRLSSLYLPSSGDVVLAADSPVTIGAAMLTAATGGATYSGALRAGLLTSTQPFDGDTDGASRHMSLGYGLVVLP